MTLPLDGTTANPQARRQLAHAVDALRTARGAGIIMRGHDLRLRAGPQGILAPAKAL